jgi:hypothetical protein
MSELGAYRVAVALDALGTVFADRVAVDGLRSSFDVCTRGRARRRVVA